MKIVILSSLYAPYNVGGAEKAVLTLAEGLHAEGTEVVVISLHPEPAESYEVRNGVRVYRLPISNLYFPWLGGRPGGFRRLVWHLQDMWNLSAARRVARILRQERPDILHTQSVSGFSVAVWAVAKALKIPCVHTLQDYYPLCIKTTLHRDHHNCERRCLDCVALTWTRKRASSQVDAVVGITEFILERHLAEGYFKNSDQQVIPHIQRPLQPSPKAPDGLLTFGFIGRVTEEKGIELLLQALTQLQGQRCRLLIAGRVDPNYFAHLQQRFPDDRVQWLGFVTEQEFYGRVDVVVIPSVWQEPLAYTCIESLFAGKSVIAADIGGLAEITRQVPLHRLFTAGDAEALAAAMQEALDEPERWSANRVASHEDLATFSQQQVLGRYREVYRSVTQRRR